MQSILPAGVIAIERWGPGCERDLLPEEARHVETAVTKRRKEFAAGRRCARLALAELGAEVVPLLPEPDRAPRWPSGVVGSITHTGEYCAAAVGRATQYLGIGVDAERLGAVEASLWPTICGAAELAWLTSQPEAERYPLATKFFCAKEAFYKCQYAFTRRWLNFHDVTVEISNEAFKAEASGGLSGRGRFSIVSGVVLAAIAMPAGV